LDKKLKDKKQEKWKKKKKTRVFEHLQM